MATSIELRHTNEIRLFNNLVEALQAAEDGDTIVIAPGVYLTQIVVNKVVRLVNKLCESSQQFAAELAENNVFIVSTVWESCVVVSTNAHLIAEGINFVIFPPSEIALSDDSSNWQQFKAVIDVRAGASITLKGCTLTGKACHGITARTRSTVTIEDTNIAGSASVLPANIANIVPSLSPRELLKLDVLAGIICLGKSTVTLNRCAISECFWSGVWVLGGNVTIKSTVIKGNNGPGLDFDKPDSSLTLEDSELTRNDVGMVATAPGSLKISQTKFTANERSGSLVGGKAKPMFVDCIFKDNSEAGLMLVNAVASFSICEFTGNGKLSGHGAEVSRGCSPVFDHCRFERNKTFGLRLLAGSRATVRECTLAENGATGLIAEDYSCPLILQCDISRNNKDGLICCNNTEGHVRESKMNNNGGSGVRAEAHAKVFIENSNMFNNKTFGLYLVEASSVITGSTIQNNGKAGVNVGFDSALQATSNTIVQSVGQAMIVSQLALGFQVDGNQISVQAA